MLLEFALGALHIHLFDSSKFGAHPVEGAARALTYPASLNSNTRVSSLHCKQVMGIPLAIPIALKVGRDPVPLAALFEDLLLGAEPILLVLAILTTAAFV
jgi:hypothetical protein